MTGRLIRGIAMLPFMALAGCGADYNPQVIEQTTFATSLGVSLAAMTRLESGVYVQDVTVGTGTTLQVGGSATANYTLWLSDGTQVASGGFSFITESPDPRDLPIPGFLQGVLGMNVGGERLILVPPELGYGEAGRQGIPGGAILVFLVELLDVVPG